MNTLNVFPLIWGMLFSAIGLGYVIYGRRQARLAFALSGAALMIYPFFVSTSFLMVLVGVVLMLIPRFIDL